MKFSKAKNVVRLAAISLFAASAAHALDLEKLKAKALPEPQSYEQAEMCASTFLLEAYLLKDDNSIPDHEAQSAKFKSGAQLWITMAYKKYIADGGSSSDTNEYVKTVLLPDVHLMHQLDFDTFTYYGNYCTLETDKLAADDKARAQKLLDSLPRSDKSN